MMLPITIQRFICVIVVSTATYIVCLKNNTANAACYITDSHDYHEKDYLVISKNILMSGILAQSNRLSVASQNIANAEVTSNVSGGDPYRRKIVVLKETPSLEDGHRVNGEDGMSNSNNDSAKIAKAIKAQIGYDNSPFLLRFQPHHPAANSNGYVKYPNVDILIENADLEDATLAIKGNVGAMAAINRTQNVIISLLKK